MAWCRNNEQSVDEHYNPMPWRYDLPAACTDGTIVEPDKELDCRPVPHVQKRPASADSIAVFHYITKSREDFELKSARGGGGGSHRTWEHFNRVQKCVFFKLVLQRILTNCVVEYSYQSVLQRPSGAVVTHRHVTLVPLVLSVCVAWFGF